MAKEAHISARASMATKKKLMELKELYGTQGEVLVVAIDRLYQQEIVEPRRRAADGLHVHHVNGEWGDNRSENLRTVRKEENKSN